MSEPEFIDIGHTQVAYRRHGSGPDVLFVHGWPLHGGTWRNIVGRLDGFTCHVIDLPGAGASRPTADTPMTFAGHVDSILAVLDHLGLDQVTLVGHDSGAMFTRMAAARRPEAVTALVMSGTEIPNHHSWQVSMYSLLSKLPGSGNVLRTMLGHDILARSPLALGGCFHDFDAIDDGFGVILGELLADSELMDSQLALIRNFDNDAVDALPAVHAKLTMPSLLIWGEDDPFFPIGKARAMVDQFAGPTRFEAIANARLFVHEEYPERFAELTADFLATVPVAG